MSKLYSLLVKGNQKAIIGFVIAAVAGLAIQVNGVNLVDATVGEVIESVVSAAVIAGGVWFKANK